MKQLYLDLDGILLAIGVLVSIDPVLAIGINYVCKQFVEISININFQFISQQQIFIEHYFSLNHWNTIMPTSRWWLSTIAI